MFTVLTQPPPELDMSVKIWIPIRAGTVFAEPGGGLCHRSQAPIGDGSDAGAFLGVLDGIGVWAVDMDPAGEPALDEGDLEPVPLRKLYGRIPDEHWQIAGRASQIVEFERTHRYCGRCGTPTQTNVADRGKACPECKHMAFPRLSPAMIVLVERGDEILLAWGRQFPGRFFSALAGFVEPGESLEDAVIREVREEVSVEVADVRYFGSQPWPFPHSLMCGFTCSWQSGEILIDPDEIIEASWYTADDLPPCPRGGMSIAGWLIEDWLRRSAETA
ncbi:NAD(+) diphosphatase [Candidatus Poriferisodalis sp.]|uniref:NAD(+) diphosphatase n=1 Tax=Candidatus Poriferisodalis sp. TaxID=3101277 RepID=UPI003D099832